MCEGWWIQFARLEGVFSDHELVIVIDWAYYLEGSLSWSFHGALGMLAVKKRVMGIARQARDEGMSFAPGPSLVQR